MRCSRLTVLLALNSAHSRANIMRSFVAKAVLSLPHTRALLDRLQSDAALRRICGWESVTSVPDETVFSRAFAEFAADTPEAFRFVDETIFLPMHPNLTETDMRRIAAAVSGYYAGLK